MATVQLLSDSATAPDMSRSPVHSWRRHLPYLVFILLTSLYLLPFMRLLLRGTDEGTLVEGAVRVTQGQLLGRDFFEVIGPGTFYWLALFFKLFGITFLASRICLFITSLGTALSLYFLTRRLCSKNQLLPVTLLFATYFGGLWPTISHHVDSNCFALMAVALLVLWRDSQSNYLLALSGMAIGATALIFQPKGVLLLFASLAWIWIERRRHSSYYSALAILISSSLCVVVCMLGYFQSRHALYDLLYATFLWPRHHYGTVNSVSYAFGILDYFHHWITPIPGFNWTIVLASVLVLPFFFVAVLPAVVIPLGGLFRSTRSHGLISLYWLSGSALWLSEIHRKDICHLVYGSPLLILLCIFYLELCGRKAVPFLQLLSIISTCLAGCTLLLALFAYPMNTRAGRVGMAAYDPVLVELMARARQGEDIFMYPYSPMYYFLTATNNPTRYSFLVYNYYTPEQFHEAVDALDSHRVRYVLWDKNVEEKIVNLLFPSERPSRPIMEPYLTKNYRPVWEHDGVFLMERRNDGYRPD